ncbi:MAG: carotenoid oxygenase family protein [Mycobacteriaceae bacterium]|nr:carotenoid oxygenase family protein [Mycobacteriaceae bacterium]
MVAIPNSAVLSGAFRPMRFEATVEDCATTFGEIPKELSGGFYRVGPTFKRPTRQGGNGLLAMDGMVQGLIFDNGRADFRNRWIRTPKYLLEERHGRAMFCWTDGEWNDWRNIGFGQAVRDAFTRGIPQGANNINCFPFAGELLASGEQGSPPVALDPLSLETRGIVAWSSQLARGIFDRAGYGDAAFTAHPKWDSATGTLYGWSYSNRAPYVTVHVVGPDATVVSRELTDAPYSCEVHDMWLTPEWIVLPFQGFVFDPGRIARGLPVHGWNPDLPTVLALVPRRNVERGEIRWITAEIEPQYAMHTLAANVAGNTLTLDAPIFERPPFPLEIDRFEGQDVALFFNLARSTLARWTVDLDAGSVEAEPLDDRPRELPKVDERHYGRGHRWGYLIGGDAKGNGMRLHSLVVRDIKTGTEQEYRLRHDRPALVMEPTFVPRTPDAPEGDGYLIVPVSRWTENLGEYAIFDTHDIASGPVCRIEIPFLLGFTPHGHWMDFR